MNLDVALEIFALGMGFGNLKTKTGLDTEKMSDERLREIFHEGLKTHIARIEQLAKKLQAVQDSETFYTQKFTAQQAFRFGFTEGFLCKQNGQLKLTDEIIDEMTRKQFQPIRFNEV